MERTYERLLHNVSRVPSCSGSAAEAASEGGVTHWHKVMGTQFKPRDVVRAIEIGMTPIKSVWIDGPCIKFIEYRGNVRIYEINHIEPSEYIPEYIGLFETPIIGPLPWSNCRMRPKPGHVAFRVFTQIWSERFQESELIYLGTFEDDRFPQAVTSQFDLPSIVKFSLSEPGESSDPECWKMYRDLQRRAS